MMEINIEKLKQRVSEVRQHREKIAKYSSIPDEEFRKDERNMLAIKHLLLQCIEACGSICTHVMAKKFSKAPSSFSECFECLNEFNVIDEGLSMSLRQMARFRNILVHRYWEIDDRKILDYARTNLADFDRFLSAIIRFLGIKSGVDINRENDSKVPEGDYEI